MNQAQLIASQDTVGEFTLTGALNFSTVETLLPQSSSLWANANKVDNSIVLDLGQITHANSAGIALLLEWHQQAQKQGQKLLIKNPHQALLDIARICNCLNLLEFI